MSLDRQEHSLAEQRTAVTAHAAKHGYRIVREYKDEGISGDRTEKRLAFPNEVTSVVRVSEDATHDLRVPCSD